MPPDPVAKASSKARPTSRSMSPEEDIEVTDFRIEDDARVVGHRTFVDRPLRPPTRARTSPDETLADLDDVHGYAACLRQPGRPWPRHREVGDGTTTMRETRVGPRSLKGDRRWVGMLEGSGRRHRAPARRAGRAMVE